VSVRPHAHTPKSGDLPRRSRKNQEQVNTILTFSWYDDQVLLRHMTFTVYL
jgi:hypothetical protein